MDLTPSHQLMHSFCIKPDARFDIQETDEEVILVLRAHPITLLPWIINGIILFILLILANIIFGSFFSPAQFFLLNFTLTIFILSYLWFNFLSYFFNVGIVTNKRVIDIDYSAVIYREVTQADLDKIEDITAKSGGYFQSLFDYGNVFIQTAGTEVNIEFLKVPKPSQVVGIVNGLIGP